MKEKGVKWWMLVAVVELVVMVVELVVVNANVGGSKVINAEKEVQGRRDEREEGGRESLAGRNRMMAKRKEWIEVKTEWNNQSKEPKNQQRQHPARNISHGYVTPNPNVRLRFHRLAELSCWRS